MPLIWLPCPWEKRFGSHASYALYATLCYGPWLLLWCNPVQLHIDLREFNMHRPQNNAVDQDLLLASCICSASRNFSSWALPTHGLSKSYQNGPQAEGWSQRVVALRVSWLATAAAAAAAASRPLVINEIWKLIHSWYGRNVKRHRLKWGAIWVHGAG